MRYISGESLQELANVYLGLEEDFSYNSRISHQPWKQKVLTTIGPTNFFQNPPIVFCYTHRIGLLSKKIVFFKKPFVLITHNSDGEIRENDPNVADILAHPLLISWFAQNLCITHSKIRFLPIGIANLQWEHGLEFFRWFYGPAIETVKTSDVYACFRLETCPSKRRECLEHIQAKVPLLEQVSSAVNLRRMEEYKFVICPIGNGVDTHRFWESLYLRCVPIVVRNPLVEIIKRETRIPMVVFESWNDFSLDQLPDYAEFDFDCQQIYLEYYELEIMKEATALLHP